MTRSSIVALVAILFSGISACVPPAPAPSQPKVLSAAMPAPGVIQHAAQVLTEMGFEITTSDANAGILTARRVRAENGNGAFVTCRFARGSIADRALRSTLTISIAARSAGDHTAITIASSVLAAYPSLTGMMAMPENETDCVSNGTAETHIVDSLGLH